MSAFFCLTLVQPTSSPSLSHPGHSGPHPRLHLYFHHHQRVDSRGPVLISITAWTLFCYDGSLESNEDTPLNWTVYLINLCPVPPNDFSLLNYHGLDSYIYYIQKNVDASLNILRTQDPFYFFGNFSSENKKQSNQPFRQSYQQKSVTLMTNDKAAAAKLWWLEGTTLSPLALSVALHLSEHSHGQRYKRDVCCRGSVIMTASRGWEQVKTASLTF